MKKLISITAIFAMMLSVTVTAQVQPDRLTGFSNFRIYMDPGHSGFGNSGYGGYSEAEKNLDVAFYIKEFLMLLTDMPAENFMFSRTTHTQAELAFSTKADQAYAFGADMYFSPHSDASGNPASESTLMLYGGRRLTTGAPAIEKLPEGGKRLGDFLIADMTSAMRMIRSNSTVTQVASRGNQNDLDFYGATRVGGPWLAVHSQTNNRTASILTEAGFHTNPIQNMQFTNREHRRMQGYTNAQSIIRWWTERQTGTAAIPPQLGIVTGFVFDDETARFINGATITVTEGAHVQTYTTDTWESLLAFKATLAPRNWTFNPATFGNGFFWMEGFTPGATVDVKVEAEGFQTVTTQVMIPLTAGAVTQDGLGVADVAMLNLMPSRVTNVAVRNDLSGNVVQRYPLDIIFTRRMDRASVETAFSISPIANYTLSWVNDFTLRVDISELAFETTYTITIDGSVARNTVTNDLLDGTGDGIPGGNFVHAFTTADLDLDPPVIVSYDPRGAQEEALRPIVRIEFDEPLNVATTTGRVIVTDGSGNQVDGRIIYHVMPNFKSVLHFVFEEDLTPQETYTVTVLAGIADLHGNARDEDWSFTFTARPRAIASTQMLNSFPPAPAGSRIDGWWQVGETLATSVDSEVSESVSSTDIIYSVNATSKRINYRFTAADGVFRLHRPGNAQFAFNAQNTLQMYLFGDGSGSTFRLTVRAGAGSGGAGTSIWSTIPIVLDWVGWRLITWNPFTDPRVEWLTGANAVPAEGTMIGVKDMGLHAANPPFHMPSFIIVDEIRVVQFMQDYYTVTFDSQGGTPVAPVNVPVDGDGLVPRPEDPTKVDHIFTGWYYRYDIQNPEFEVRTNTGVANIRTVAGSTVNSTIIAQMPVGTLFTILETTVVGTTTWGRVELELTHDNVVWFGEAAGGTHGVADGTGNPGTYTAWISFVVLPVVVQQTALAPWDFENDVVTENITLYAQWREATELYTVTFSVAGANGTLTAEVNDTEITSGADVLEGRTVNFTAAPNEGYRVKEWTVNGDVVADNTSNYLTLILEANIVVTVEFEAIYHTVTFESLGGTTIAPVFVQLGKLITKPENPTKEGYTFLAWQTAQARSNGVGVGNIRSEAGAAGGNATIVAQLPLGTRINIVETVYVGTVVWGRFEIYLTHDNVVWFGEAGGGTGVADGSGNPGWHTAWASLGVFAVIENPGSEPWDFDTDVVTQNMALIAQWEPAVGLDNITFANLQIHPNPFVSEVTITGAQNSVLEIVNVLGAVVHTQPIRNSSETIQLNQLSSGIYFFRVSRDGQSRTLQVIKR